MPRLSDETKAILGKAQEKIRRLDRLALKPIVDLIPERITPYQTGVLIEEIMKRAGSSQDWLDAVLEVLVIPFAKCRIRLKTEKIAIGRDGRALPDEWREVRLKHGPNSIEVHAYMKCSECDTPYVARRCFMVRSQKSTAWLWQRDCKHKNAEPKVVQGS